MVHRLWNCSSRRGRTGFLNTPLTKRSLVLLAMKVLQTFEKAGYNIMSKNANEQSLLHLAAGLRSGRSDSWLELLQDRGLDPIAQDKNGRTPVDIAKVNEHLYLYR